MEHNLWTLFSAVARRVPERTAVVAGRDRVSYAALAERATRLGHVLAAHGLGHHTPRQQLERWQTGQDVVALYMLNGPEYLEAMFGCYAARTVPANVNYRYVADELAYLLNDCGGAAIIYHLRLAPVLAEALPRLARSPLLVHVDDGSGERPLASASVWRHY
jgi:acyl-CoA synthetase (AMP-forming)/AMP-acid ligase II